MSKPSQTVYHLKLKSSLYGIPSSLKVTNVIEAYTTNCSDQSHFNSFLFVFFYYKARTAESSPSQTPSHLRVSMWFSSVQWNSSPLVLPLVWIIQSVQSETAIGYDGTAGKEEEFYSLVVSLSCILPVFWSIRQIIPFIFLKQLFVSFSGIFCQMQPLTATIMHREEIVVFKKNQISLNLLGLKIHSLLGKSCVCLPISPL